jgi:rSAM/selenodomain-associated transferase 1
MLHHPETGAAADRGVATATVPGARPRPGQIALAAMAKVPIAGAVKTRLSPPLTPEQAAELARCFLVDRVEQLGELAASDRHVAFTPREREPELRGLLPSGVRLVPQVGTDLGARMDRLLSDLLAEGYAGAIAVGTDTPTLPTAYLGQACEALRSSAADMVLGPSRDGGYYLIGLSAPAPELFVNVPWSTAGVCAETLRRARVSGRRISVLPSWVDVDRVEDLAELGREPVPGAYRPSRTLAFVAGLAF